MPKLDLEQMGDTDLARLIDNRWSSSDELWDVVKRTYKNNVAVYSNQADWLTNIPYVRQNWIVQDNRIFVNMEAVINSLIANPAGINILPGKAGEAAADFARELEKYFKKKLTDRNVKETVRKGLRNLYFGRIIVIKPFWNPAINDFDFRAIDPRNVRFGKYSTKEQDSEFGIEEIEDNLCAVVSRFPEKRDELLKKFGMTDDSELYIKNPDVKYKEAWVQDYVIFKLDNIILGKIKNPYWDYEGILLTEEEVAQLAEADGPARRDIFQTVKLDQDTRRQAYAAQQMAQGQEGEAQDQAEGEVASDVGPTAPDTQAIDATGVTYSPYYFNYFDSPRKPYIFATIFNNENTPIGRTDMITLSADLQRGIDKRKMDIDENAELANGILKVDAGVMGKADAQRIRFQTKGIIWGKGVKDGVTRETGQALPQMVFDDMVDSRSEIDNIMAASSAFRGEREGQETKAGRLALIQQSYLRLNELVQVVDYTYGEIYGWAMQLSKSRYTEYHKAQWLEDEDDQHEMELIQDDFDPGSEVTVIPGKTLPVDDEFKFEQAQNDVMKGFLSPVDYLKIAQYDDPKELAKNAVIYQVNPVHAVGISPEEMAQIAPPQQPEENPPSESINFKDLPIDGQIQLAAKGGIQLDPNIIIAEKKAEADKSKQEAQQKAQSKAPVETP